MRIFSLFAILTLLLSCKQNYVEQAQGNVSPSQARPVVLEEVEKTTTPIPIQASGLIGSEAEMNLSFKIGGIIARMNVAEGASVRKGQLLATLRTTEIDAQVIKARQGVEKATRDLERIQALYADSAATLEQVQNLQTAFEVAQADLEIATFNQSYARIVAPARGRILKQYVESNELINAGNTVFRLASDEGKGFVLKIGVADRDVIRIRMNDSAHVQLDAYPEKSFKAYVSEIAEAADPMTGTFEIELQINPDQYTLKNGFVGKVTLFPSNQSSYLRISLDALVEGYEDRANIYQPDASQAIARQVQVRPLYIGDGFFAVTPEALGDNTAVITYGAAFLQDGDSIRVVQDVVLNANTQEK